MGFAVQHSGMRGAKIDVEQSSSNPKALTSTPQSHSRVPVPRLAGLSDQPGQATGSKTAIQPLGPGHHHSARFQTTDQNSRQIVTGQPFRPALNAVNVLLPYCTMVPPLSEAQVIALSDVAGSLRELVLLALGAVAGDSGCVRKLEAAVGEESAVSIAEFFMDEWEMDG